MIYFYKRRKARGVDSRVRKKTGSAVDANGVGKNVTRFTLPFQSLQ